MSRTTRRTSKNAKVKIYLDTREEFEERQLRINCFKAGILLNGVSYRYVVNYYAKWNMHCTVYEQYVAKKKARHHGDQKSGYYTPPSWFVNEFFNKPLRQRHKQQIHHAIVNDTCDEMILLKSMRSAMWEWT